MVVRCGHIKVNSSWVNFWPISLMGLKFSHGYPKTHVSLFVELTDNKFTCLTNPIMNKHSLRYLVQIKFSDDSHHNY